MAGPPQLARLDHDHFGPSPKQHHQAVQMIDGHGPCRALATAAVNRMAMASWPGPSLEPGPGLDLDLLVRLKHIFSMKTHNSGTLFNVYKLILS